MLAVTDDGTGIAPEIAGQVFEPFFTTKEVGKGSGLGLSMVYGFAKQSRGHVKIYSELGHGTTVKLFLPRSRTSRRRARPPGLASGPPGNRELLLVVEDDPALRALVVSCCIVSAIARSRRATRRARCGSLAARPRSRCCSRTWCCRAARTAPS